MRLEWIGWHVKEFGITGWRGYSYIRNRLRGKDARLIDIEIALAEQIKTGPTSIGKENNIDGAKLCLGMCPDNTNNHIVVNLETGEEYIAIIAI